MWHSLLMSAAVIAVAALVLLAMGRTPISKSGYVLPWNGTVNSPENSQHISDWYSFSHIIHGMAFYALFRLISRRRWPVGVCLVAAVLLEASWEIFENTSFTIERYRTATIALSYYGDSVLNSVCDILFCVAGFFMASYMRVWMAIALVVAMEVGVALMIRDNLLLNIVMFIYPMEWIKAWQSGA